MRSGSAGLRRWTQRFTLASAGAFVVFLVTVTGGDWRVAVLIGIFGFVCPMIFGMAYLLLPPYVGTTLVDHRLPAVHFVLAYLGAGLLVWGRTSGTAGTVLALGGTSWSLGVAVFLGSLLATVGPALRDDPSVAFGGGERPQRSTRLATAMIPIALSYLVAGTVGLLGATGVADVWVATFPQVVHSYALGFGAVLIFALGARLLIGFFHVRLPRPLVWTVLLTGGIAPLGLGLYFWVQPWFLVGGASAGVAMVGYLSLVAVVAWRTERARVGLSGIVLGAVAGVGAIVAGGPVALHAGHAANLAVHRVLVLAGFFPLTIVGYAYLFFPVPNGRFLGASTRGARATIGMLAVGAMAQVVGIVAGIGVVRWLGTAASVAGATGYAYLLGRRFAIA